MSQKQKTFLKAAMDFFGLNPGQTLGAFAQELEDMGFAARRDLANQLRSAGIDCADPI